MNIKPIYKLILPIILVLSMVFPNFASANELKIENINTVHELHNFIVSNNLASLNENGQLLINQAINVSNENTELFEQYLKDLEQLNSGVEEGLMYFDANYQIKIHTPEKIFETTLNESIINPKTNILFEENLKLISPMEIPGAPPALNVKALVQKNRAELEKTYNTLLEAQKWGGGNAFSGIVGWWVGKVAPNGAWDYKVQPGYSPWSKKFTGQFFDGKNVINSAYIGNYNYGYTGELLFSKNALLTAGDAVSLVTTFLSNVQKGKFKAQLDTEEDKIPVRRGFDNAVKYD